MEFNHLSFKLDIINGWNSSVQSMASVKEDPYAVSSLEMTVH